VLSGRGLCDELVTRPEESYRLCCVVVCDLETSRMGAPYIYDISHLRVNLFELYDDARTCQRQICLGIGRRTCDYIPPALCSIIFLSLLSSSCSGRIRRFSCSLILKMKLVPPSLPRSPYVPSSFWFIL